MAQKAPRNDENGGSTKRLALGLLESVTSLWFLCTEQANRASRQCTRQACQCTRQASRVSRRLAIQCTKQASRASSSLTSKTPSFPSARPRQLLATISNKAIQFRQKKRIGEEPEGGGVWQRTIMMGDKCQPLDFPGVIYYDSDGKRLSELPMKSPRASPLPSYAYKTMNSKQ